MTDIYFDGNKSFPENCESFLETLEIIDPEMTAILCDNWNELVSLVQGGERDLRKRAQVNTAIASALDSIAKSSESKDKE